MRPFIIIFTSVIVATIGGFIIYKKQPGVMAIQSKITGKPVYNDELFAIKHHVPGIKKFLQQNKYNTDWCFLIDMKISSGMKRFFVYDLKNDAIFLKGLVTHGSGNNASDTIEYSNVPGNNCTSLGKYRIGQSYYGKFGLAYKLYGLDKTNSNAYSRFVVLHSHACVPDNEVGQKICRSWGCPTVSPTFLVQLKPFLNRPGKPVLLWIFN